MLVERITQNIKEAMLAGDKQRVVVLRGLKAAILQEEIAQQKRDVGLGDEDVLIVLAREAKKRTEAAEMYAKANYRDRADAELAEKTIIEEFLPKQLTDDELNNVVVEAIAAAGQDAHMGKIIAAVKEKIGQTADGGRIAAAVKKQLG